MWLKIRTRINYDNIIKDDININYQNNKQQLIQNNKSDNILNNSNFRNNQNYVTSEKKWYNHSYWKYKFLIYILIYIILLFLTFPLISINLLVGLIYFWLLLVFLFYFLIRIQNTRDKKNNNFIVTEKFHKWFFIYTADKKINRS